MTRAGLEARIWEALAAYHRALEACPHGPPRQQAQASFVTWLADLAGDYADTRRNRTVPPEVTAAARAEKARLASLAPGSAGPPGTPSLVTLAARRHLLAEASKPRFRRKDRNDDEGTRCA